MWHDSFMCVTLLIHTCDVPHSYAWRASFIRGKWLTQSYVWRGPFICVTCLIHVCDMPHSCVTCLIHRCDAPHSYVWHESFIRGKWLTHMCDMTHSYVWHDSFMCNMTHSYRWGHDNNNILAFHHCYILQHDLFTYVQKSPIKETIFLKRAV